MFIDKVIEEGIWILAVHSTVSLGWDSAEGGTHLSLLLDYGGAVISCLRPSLVPCVPGWTIDTDCEPKQTLALLVFLPSVFITVKSN